MSEIGPKGDYPANSLAVCAGTSLRVWTHTVGQLLSTAPGGHVGGTTRLSETREASHDAKNLVQVDLGLSATAVSWNRNNKVVAVGLENGQVQIRYANGTYMSTLKTDSVENDKVSSLSWSTGSKTLAVGSRGTVCIHDMTKKMCKSHDLEDPSVMFGVAHHPEDRFLAVSGREVKLYSLRMEENLGSCVCPASSAVQSDICFPSISIGTGKPYMAAGSDRNGVVCVWDYTTETIIACDKFRHMHKGPCKVALAPLEPFLLYSAGIDGLLKMQDLRCASSIASPTAMTSVHSGVSSLSIHEQTGHVAVGTSDGNVLLFEAGLASKKPLHTLYCGRGTENSDTDCPILDVSWQHSYHNLPLHAYERVQRLESEAVRPQRTPRSRVSPLVDAHERHSAHGVEIAQSREYASQQTRQPLSEVASPSVSNNVPQKLVSSSLERHDEVERRASVASRGSEPWRIRAGGLQPSDTPTSSSAQDLAVASNEQNKKHTKPSIALNTHTRMKDAGDTLDTQGDSASIRDTILALHLDMVTMFEEQQQKTNDMMKQLMDRQDALASDVRDLQRTIHDLLTQRSNATWL